ncbi:MAG: hypothetical protein QXU99_06270 [Candidatus Bathyarchaeia archaeon]
MVQLARRKAKKQKLKKKNRYVPYQKQEIDAKPLKKKKLWHRSSKMLIAILGLTILLSCFLIVNLSLLSQDNYEDTNVAVPKAAILDGLYSKSPNETLIETLIRHLSDAGYMVEVYKGANVTIDLLRNLGGYEILILRLHSAVHTDNFLYVFSGEEYTESKYVDEQLAGAVRKSYTFNESEPPYFSLNSVFIGKNNPKGLNGTIVIMAGCNGTATPYVIQRFLQEGVKAYIAWNGYVGLSYSDEAISELVRLMCAEGLDPKAAVEKVNRETGPDPVYGSQLVCTLP